MAKYLFVYRGSVPSTPPSPAEIQASFQKWGEWIGKFTQSGHIMDPGDGLQMSGKVCGSLGSSRTDPTSNRKRSLAAIALFRPTTMIKRWPSRECPAVDEDGSVEIRQLAGYMDK